MVTKALLHGECDTTSILEFCSRARGLGCEAIALRIGPGEPLTLETPDAECAAVRTVVGAADLRLAAVFMAFDPACHFGSRGDAARYRAIDRARAALDRAARIGAETLVVVPAVIAAASDEPSDGGSYADALNGTHYAIQRLRYHAERCGVTLGLAVPGNRFLLSPVELRELIDEEHVPCLGACLDLEACAPIGRADDWIRILAPRICCVRAGDAIGDADWRHTLRALDEVGYEGSICCTNPGVLARCTSPA
jgi:hexulose-6-phosphate isomerase